MELTVSKEELKKGLYWTQNVVEKKTTKPILANCLLDFGNAGLRVSATDLEVGVSVEIPAKVKNSGQVAVPAKNLYEITRELSSDEVTLKRRDDHWLEISSGNSKFKMVGLPAQEFPTMPEISGKKNLVIESSVLRNMIQKTLFAVSTDEAKFNLNGVYLETEKEKKIRMVATDGHRLSAIEREISPGSQLAKGVLLPRKGVLELQKLLEKEEGVLPLSIEGRNVCVQSGPVTLFIRLIEGDFPDYRQVIPKKNDRMVKVNRLGFEGALRRVSLLSQDHNRGVKMIFTSGRLELMCSNPELGEAREEIACEYKGERIEVGFNYRYFLDVLAVLDDDSVNLEFKDEVSPCLIRSPSDAGFLSLVMPMRL